MLPDNKFIFMDSEFGGIGMQYSLLSFCFIITDNKFNILDELNLFLKPNDCVYHVCGEAMNVNKINLIDHDKIALTYKEGGTKLYNFINTHSNFGALKLIPVGHGFSEDLLQLFDKLMNRKTWEAHVSYRRLDTSVTLQFLKICGIFPETVSGSLSSLIEYFKIPIDGELHSARTDTLCTIKVLQKMVELVVDKNIKVV